MKPFLNRVVVALTAGYILLYYSEFLFWGRYIPGEPYEWLFTYIVYSLVTYVLLSVIGTFRVRSLWALFLSGAVYGWLIEGVVVQTLYDNFPYHISWTGLAWHSLISVVVGWYYVINVLQQNNYVKTIRISVLIGLFYGFWAISWWVEDDVITPVSDFSWYIILTSVTLIVAYWTYSNVQPIVFEITKEEWAISSGIVLFFAFNTVLVQPAALVVLPLLFGLVFVTLRRNKRIERRESVLSVYNDVALFNYVLLLLIPVTAIMFYAAALSFNVLVETNALVGVISIPLGFIMLLVSIVKIFKG